MGDWVIDGIRVNGAEINPSQLTLNFSSGFDFRDMVSVDNMKAGVTVGLKQNLFTPHPPPPSAPLPPGIIALPPRCILLLLPPTPRGALVPVHKSTECYWDVNLILCIGVCLHRYCNWLRVYVYMCILCLTSSTDLNVGSFLVRFFLLLNLILSSFFSQYPSLCYVVV